MPVAPGRVGTLTDEQSEKLREMWAAAFKVFGQTVSNTNSAASSPGLKPPSTGEANGSPVSSVSKRGRFARMLSRTKSEASLQETSTANTDKYGASAAYKEALAQQSPAEIRQTFWSMVKADHPDALLLRFLRARKWDVQKALEMMIATNHWRGKVMEVEKIVERGEAGFLEDGDEAFMLQVRKGKSILHGTDVEGRPICLVRSRLHRPAEQSAKTMEQFTVLTMETARLMLRGPIDTATVIFDLNGIEAKYMDLTPVRFIIKCFEAHYPESLGTCCIYGAPWFFRPIWSIVKGLLDPVVAAKIKFANSQQELSEIIPQSDIIKELGGPRAWEYEYIEPVEGENDRQKDTATRDRLIAERGEIVDKFVALTQQWVAGQQDEKSEADRHAVAKELEQDYWRLDPYVRARTHYDRVGYIESDGAYNPRATFPS
ncbi:CRAL-TRIO domain-containing protein [Protomyces lactucae-debilis]|uniref:CRAL-TRIO domain-containing protein n=1 Tax=Protomyces lactucae-debilis TaxID=2754530 RepID=A0A1Y2FI34_PROLT|nr:CRAL-TRIO domain-containing protein [Protomyces lactucae-debilis]ORY83257.1 CRAL-TRIO domain-containing protein [Protomyces lactucae-debilis]